jgi:hypothetical protein
MNRFFERGLRSVAAVAAIIAALLALSPSEAAAQGGILCELGGPKYRRCCNESYRLKPGLQARARSNDIRDCMRGRPRAARPESGEDAAQPDGERAAERPAKSSRASKGRSQTVAGVRRIDCAAGACQAGCSADEIAISAFCKFGGHPFMDGEQKAYCASSEGTEAPVFLICARK